MIQSSRNDTIERDQSLSSSLKSKEKEKYLKMLEDKGITNRNIASACRLED